MGAAFLEGRGVERDPEKAATWLRLAAQQGDAAGQRNLALCYYEGWGVPQDQAEAARWYEKAAEQDDPDAQDMLSWMKTGGRWFARKDYEGARRWAEKAAAHGRRRGHGAAGRYPSQRARRRTQRRSLPPNGGDEAAVPGHPEAQVMLGAAYLAGRGVEWGRG